MFALSIKYFYISGIYVYIYISKNVYIYIINISRVHILKNIFQMKNYSEKGIKKKEIPKENACRCNGHLEMIIFDENFYFNEIII